MANSQRAKIDIKEAIEAMPPHSILWDTTISGFNVRRQNSPVVTFSIVYRHGRAGISYLRSRLKHIRHS